MRARSLALTSVCAVAAMMLPAAAHAATTITFNGVSGTYANTSPGPNTRFKDVFVFSTPSAGYLSLDWQTLYGAILTNIKASVSLNGILLTGTDTVTPAGLLKTRSLNNVLVSAGTQTITVAGSAMARSSYSGTISFAAVPEPAAWALMTIGFGAVAFGLRRKSRHAVRANLSFA
ncbi:FxDxF family PEP-CTERM protein [Novosphingobium flavum]|uniref:FxDxF family PEP-CTERM protein n=1 Tax=Novosphingobium aerophilum TaxID=2839843 RepID=UPI00163AFB46|nr:FxDxF family PEP-CTERM protein [Novosphingobium aerophilum]MBC2662436.1 FxDxF family PEP-CTERM protein [Novosphingobium aerophilum]